MKVTTPENKKQNQWNQKACRCVAMLAVLLALASSNGLADTLVPTTINTTTWTKAGNRYIISADSTVPSGQVLTIEPGVDVVLGAGVRLTVPGTIYASGTSNEPVVFRSPSSAVIWDRILVSDTASRFESCVFSNATTALSLYLYGGTREWEVLSCRFENCGTGIYGESDRGHLNPTISNCRFASCGSGIVTYIHGGTTRGHADPRLLCNTFSTITNVAVDFTIGSYADTSQPLVLNNTIVDAGTALRTRSPYDVVAKNNLIVQCEEGIRRDTSDALNLMVSYNGFYANGADFLNYPASYGSIVWDNANGDPADINFNIFEDPLLVDTNLMTISASSPCIDAGDPSGEYLDGCFPPSQGTTVNDIGAYGGPSACGWIAPLLTSFFLTSKAYPAITIHPSTPGTYRLEYTSVLGNTNIWTQITNLNLLTDPWTYIDYESPGVGQRWYRGVLLP